MSTVLATGASGETTTGAALPVVTGLCECGCGNQTTISRWSDAKRGYVRGQPKRFCKGHGPKTTGSGPNHHGWKGGRLINRSGYVLVYMPDHPRASIGDSYVFEHILVAEAALGKPLPPGAVVHHVNENRSDNRCENLVVCDRAYHVLIHQRLRSLQAREQ